MDAVATIYGHHVETSCASFEETPPSATEMHERFLDLGKRDLPYLVAETGDRIIGFAFAGPYKERSAYRFTVEDSIYVAPNLGRQGVGTLLLEALIRECTLRGYRQMMAVIGDSGNRASIALHAKLGFRTVGTAANVGFKFERWVDIVYMQRTLGQPNKALSKSWPAGNSQPHQSPPTLTCHTTT